MYFGEKYRIYWVGIRSFRIQFNETIARIVTTIRHCQPSHDYVTEPLRFIG